MPPSPKTAPAGYQPKAAKAMPLDQQLCCVRLSPDGKTLVAGSFEGTVRRWDTGPSPFAELSPLRGHNGWVQAVALHPDGKRLFSADSWGRLTGWPLETKVPNPLWTVAGAHDGWIHALAIRPDGQLVASGGRDRTVRLTSPDKGAKVRTLDAGEDVLAVAFHPDGKSLLTGDLKGVIKQWDLATGKRVREFDAKVLFRRDRIQDVGGVRCFAFNADGSVLFAGGTQPKSGGFVQGTPIILAFDWKTGTGKPVYQGANDNEGYVLDLHWHPDGFLMAVSSGQPGQGKIIFQRPGESQPLFAQPIPNPHALAFHGRRLVVAATNANSAGNGRVNGKNMADYPGNYSPLHVFELPG